jgi:hypothetical protein
LSSTHFSSFDTDKMASSSEEGRHELAGESCLLGLPNEMLSSIVEAVGAHGVHPLLSIVLCSKRLQKITEE